MANTMCLLRNCQKLIGRFNLRSIARLERSQPIQNFCRTVSTSNTKKTEKLAATACEEKPKKFWVSYGFSNESEEIDRHAMHLTFFCFVTLVFTCGSFLLIYMPDFMNKDWTLREAYLELKRREDLGLPLIDPNLIDPSKVHLPTDEELGDREILI